MSRKSTLVTRYMQHKTIDLSTARPNGPALSDYLLYALVNSAYAKSFHHFLVRKLVSNVLKEQYGFHIIISVQSNDV